MNTASIYGLTLDDLQEWLLLHDQKKFRAQQIWDWLYVKRVQEFADMSNLSKDLIASLEANFSLQPLNQVVVQESADGTTKYLFQLEDKLMIETVLMYHEYGLSVCVTTQVGCDIGCTFCASGIKRKQRDLTAGEIVAQIMQVQHYLDEKGNGERVSHIVVMGIGEPFDNYDHVMKFLHIVNHSKGLAIGARHMTVSTSGLAPKIREFADNGLQVNLALSLHAPNNEIRSRMMRINRKHPIEEVMAAIDEYLEKTNRRITFEYIMISGVNDNPEQARELAALLKDKRHLSYVNLIPYNKVAEHIKYERSTEKAMQAFYDILQKNKINCVIRKEHGTDIDAACGQLRSKHLDK